MRIMVYRPEEPVIEGVVLTFINIDAQKKAQEEIQDRSERFLSSSRRFAECIVDTVRESMLVLDGEMRVVTANRSFYRTFSIPSGAAEGANLFELEGGQWNTPELRSLLLQLLEQEKSFEGYPIEHEFPRIGFKRLVLNGRILRDDFSEDRRVLLAMEDWTGQADSAPKEAS